MAWEESDIITTDKFLSLQNPIIAYIKTDTLVHNCPYPWRGQMHTFRTAPIWISGHADAGVTTMIYNRYHQYTHVWFTINMEHSSPNLIAIPLGITNDCDDSPIHRIYGNTKVMVEAVSEPRIIKNTVYMNFQTHTCPSEREPVYNMFKDKSWVTLGQVENTLRGRLTFLRDIRSHKFVLCPRGGGVDTHRLWETLYMCSIPIVKRHVALNDFGDLPICWINDWSEVTPEFLESEYKRITEATWNIEKLKFSYWERLVQTHASRYAQ
jgi:hypothetical protein